MAALAKGEAQAVRLHDEESHLVLAVEEADTAMEGMDKYLKQMAGDCDYLPAICPTTRAARSDLYHARAATSHLCGLEHLPNALRLHACHHSLQHACWIYIVSCSAYEVPQLVSTSPHALAVPSRCAGELMKHEEKWLNAAYAFARDAFGLDDHGKRKKELTRPPTMLELASCLPMRLWQAEPGYPAAIAVVLWHPTAKGAFPRPRPPVCPKSHTALACPHTEHFTEHIYICTVSVPLAVACLRAVGLLKVYESDEADPHLKAGSNIRPKDPKHSDRKMEPVSGPAWPLFAGDMMRRALA